MLGFVIFTEVGNLLSTFVMVRMRVVLVTHVLGTLTVLSMGSCDNELYQSKETELLKCCAALSECVHTTDIF